MTEDSTNWQERCAQLQAENEELQRQVALQEAWARSFYRGRQQALEMVKRLQAERASLRSTASEAVEPAGPGSEAGAIGNSMSKPTRKRKRRR